MKPLKPKKKIKLDREKKAKKKVVNKVRPAELPVHVIAHSKATMGRQEEQAAAKVIHAGMVGSNLEVAKFEYDFCRFLGLPEGHAIALSSGTAARFIALTILGAEGANVAYPAYSSGLRKAIDLVRATALPIDISADGALIDDGAFGESGAKIFLLPHLFGLPSDLQKLREARPGFIVEDCSQALGAKVQNKHVGLAGDFAVYSFSTDKVISTGGQGGMLVSKDKDLIDKARIFSKSNTFNFALTDMQAAIGRVQLEKLDKLMARRDDIFDAYREAGFDLLDNEEEGIKPVRQSAVMYCENAAAVMATIKEGCVECLQPVDLFDDELQQSAPRAAALSETTISLPIYPHLSNDEVREMVDLISDALDANLSDDSDSADSPEQS